MTPDTGDAAPDQATWRRINDLFHRALDCDPAERAAFLDRECGGDDRLRAEVASLLAAHATADEWLEHPAASGGASRLPRTVGHYRLLDVLGTGGMGVVYLAEDLRLGRPVALKAIAPALSGDERRQERLRREARAAAALVHPGIATVYALEEIEGQLYIASEYVPGNTLRDELMAGALPLEHAARTGLSVARAVAAAHARGIVHRDLKPENLMRSVTGDVKVLDFGLAQLKAEGHALPTLTADGGALGTPGYMAPEQIRHADVDARADVFALGVLLYEMSTGTPPFAGATPAARMAAVLEVEPDPLRTRLAPDGAATPLARGLETITARCLRKSSEHRYRSAQELADDLEKLVDGAPLGIARGPAPPRTPAAFFWWQFHQAATAAAYALLLVPLWLAHRDVRIDARLMALGPRVGLWLFLAGLAAAVTAGSLRLHAWFAARLDLSRSRDHGGSLDRGRSIGAGTGPARWLRVSELVFVADLLVLGLLTDASHQIVAVVLVAAAAAVLIACTVIEPATAQAAFEPSTARTDRGVR